MPIGDSDGVHCTFSSMPADAGLCLSDSFPSQAGVGKRWLLDGTQLRLEVDPGGLRTVGTSRSAILWGQPEPGAWSVWGEGVWDAPCFLHARCVISQPDPADSSFGGVLN